jgi:hypothetical protein
MHTTSRQLPPGPRPSLITKWRIAVTIEQAIVQALSTDATAPETAHLLADRPLSAI